MAKAVFGRLPAVFRGRHCASDGMYKRHPQSRPCSTKMGARQGDRTLLQFQVVNTHLPAAGICVKGHGVPSAILSVLSLLDWMADDGLPLFR